ncbi:WxL domain-containing protein [Enterococcus mundtii]|uniref:WxL domain-containing protein n=1 Tax=Enterococcus mundtii TaxID=53346 RepID=UPI001CCAA4C8|nr:WxL domain-containing protein [Enterococcus mundtii]UBM05582.1 WxL domain-containing protein [Enterococcus mundtii]
MTMTWRKTKVLLSVTLVVLHVLFLPVSMIYAETVEAPAHETEEDLEPLELPRIKNFLEEGEIREPRFFFTQSRMQGMIEEPIKVTFFSDQEVSEARVTLPNEAKLLKEKLPAGLTAKQGAHSHEWIIQTGRVRNAFVLPVVFDSIGNYEVAVENVAATIEVQEQEETSGEVPVEETEPSDENFVGQEELKEENGIEGGQVNEQPTEEVREPVVEAPQEQQIDAESEVIEPTVFDGKTEEVTTMAQFRAAVANPDIGIISVQANLTEATANVLTVDRPLLIQGNGYTLTFGINGFYFQLAEVVEPSAFRIENTRLTKVGTTPLINATVESSKNWTVELENITEVNANTMRLASLPEGNIHFTGGVSNFTRTTSAQTFIVAKEVLATNQAEVTISRGNATVLFSSATVADPKMTVEQGATVTITTTAGNANTIDLRGENPEIAVQNGHLSVGTIGPATATTPTNTTNNTIVLSGVSPKFNLDQESTFSLRTTLSKRGIYLAGNNSQLTVNNSEFSVTSATAEAIRSEGQNGILTIVNSNMNLTTTTGRAMRVNGKINILRSNLSTNSTTGLPISTDNANGEIVIDESQLNLTMSSSNNGILLSGTDSLLKISNNSEVKLTSGSGTARNILFNGARSKMIIENQSKLILNTSGPTSDATDTANNAIQFIGESSELTVSNQSILDVNVTAGAKRGVFFQASNGLFQVLDNSELNIKGLTGQAVRLNGSNSNYISSESKNTIETTTAQALRVSGKIELIKTNLSSNSTTGVPLYTDNANGEIIIDESQLNLAMSSSNNGIRLNAEDSLLNIKNNSEVKLTSGSGTARNILFNGARSKMIIENQSKLILNTSGPTSAATDTANNAIQFVGESSELTVRNQSILDVNVIAGAKRGVFFQNSSNKFNIDEESEAKINTEQANSLHMQGANQKTTISGKSSLILKSNWNVHGSTSEHSQRSSLYVGMNGVSNSIIEVDEQSSILTESNLSSSIVLEGRVNSFYVKNKSEINLYSGSTTSISTGAFATLRFLNSGDSLFKIENSMFSILKSGGSAPGIRMLGDKNSIEVVDGGIFQVKNPGNGTPSDGNTQGGNQGVHLTSGNDTSFSVTDPGSQVTILAENGPAIDLSGTGKVKNSNGGYFEAVGRTATASGGVFRAGVLDVEFDNPLFMDFRNNRSGGGNLFNVASGSSLKASNSDLAVWKNGSNLDGDPDLNFPTLDFSFSGTNFNTLGATSQPDVLNTGTFGTTGLTTYSRLSSNNARWAIADELRVPTNADKKIHGHISIPVGLEESRSAWEGEATVIVEVERANGTKTEHTAKTVGHSNEEPGISIYGEEPRAGLFEVELEEYLQKGDKVKIKDVRLTSGELTQGYENIILTDTVEVFPIIPPTPAKFSSSVVSNDSTAIKGFTENKEVTVTATHNGEPINTENVVVENDGTFTLDLSDLSLREDDKIQVFLRDREGSAAAAGVMNPPLTNDEQGNINPTSPLSFRDKLFDEATVLMVQDLRPVSPVDPLDPETEINPENKPQLPEDQGRLSIDFVSQLQFGTQGISVTDQTYYAQPQRLLNEDGTVNETEERPNYVQISDRRPENDRNGWQLAVTQNNPFTSTNNRELNGARLRLTNQQLATAQGGSAPEFQQTNPLALVPGNRRILLMAQGTEGTGTWIYRFGDQETANKSVALDVPKGANPESTRYETTLTWELSAVPDN